MGNSDHLKFIQRIQGLDKDTADPERIVPYSKHDHIAVKNLRAASKEMVLEKLDELLEWIQDINWPVAKGVAHTCGRR